MHITVDVIKRDLLAWHEFREEDTKNMKCKNVTLKDPVLRTYSYFFFCKLVISKIAIVTEMSREKRPYRGIKFYS